LLPTPAQYLLRIDDLCPTVHRDRWQALEALIKELRLKPILAVVPENRDPELIESTPDPDFWPKMRALESAGAAVGLHGFRHLCLSRGRGLVPIHRTSEFAGVPLATQRSWIREGLALLRSHGLNPRVWVAPRHGFDSNTLKALREQGVSILSDGFAGVPFLRAGMTWIPQQIWEPVEKQTGLWTICIHPGSMGEEQITALRGFLDRHAAQFTSVDRVLHEFPPARLGMIERIHAAVAISRIYASRIRNQFANSR